jgi:NADH-quinone oxidoreductase subunit A
MQINLANILVFLGLGAGFLAVVLGLGRLVRPKVDEAVKLSIYECGERPLARAWFNFNPRFYIVALVFLVFDVEVAFTFPVVTVFERWVREGNGLFAFLELFVFVAVLAVGLAYVWVKRDLEWVQRSREDAAWHSLRSAMPATRATAAHAAEVEAR